MSHVTRDPRLVDIPPEHRAYLTEVIERRGLPGAARALGLGRTALLGVMARGAAMPGTASLIREAIRRRDAAK